MQELGVAPGTIRKLVLIVVNSERDPEEDIDHQDTVPTTWQVVDQLLFGAGARATLETQEFLKDVTQQWRAELARAGAGGGDAFATDAEIHVVQVNLRDVGERTLRRQLLRVPTAFTIAPDDVSALIAAGRQVLRQSPDYQALLRSLQAQRTP
jgi:NTE family protein